MKELIWVLQFAPLKDIMMASLMVQLLGSHWDEKMEMHWDLQMEQNIDWNLGLMKELRWVLQLAPMMNLKTASLVVHLLESH